MAIYHFSAKVIQRSQGRSAVAAAAYRSGSELEDERLGRSHDFTAKADVVHSEILLPEGAAARWLDRSTLGRFLSFDEKIVSMVVRSMSTREILGHLRDLYGIEVPRSPWSPMDGGLQRGPPLQRARVSLAEEVHQSHFANPPHSGPV